MGKVLVIDDDAMNLKMAEFILKKGSYEVEKAGSGEEAIEILKGAQFDLILLDILMPGMDGYQTLDAIKEQNLLNGAKVAFLTATVDDEVSSKAVAMGVAECIKKPFVPNQFLEVLGNILA